MRLTDREQYVLERIAVGQTNKEIAAALGISIQAVKIHVSLMLRKLIVPNRAALVLAALRHGLLDERELARIGTRQS